jgi:hypothetical protein
MRFQLVHPAIFFRIHGKLFIGVFSAAFFFLFLELIWSASPQRNFSPTLGFSLAREFENIFQAKAALTAFGSFVRQMTGVAIITHRRRTHSQNHARFMKRDLRIGQALQHLRARFFAETLSRRARHSGSTPSLRPRA